LRPYISALQRTLSSRLLLPLGILTREELLEYLHNVLQSGQVLLQLFLHLGFIGAELDIEVLPVRASAHGRAEHGLDEEAVVRLEGRAIGATERVGELLGRLSHVLAEGDAGKFQTPVVQTYQLDPLAGLVSAVQHSPHQPYQALGRNMRARLELGSDKVLEVLGIEGGCKVALADFLVGAGVSFWAWRELGSNGGGAYLNVAEHVLLHGRKGDRAKQIFRTRVSRALLHIANGQGRGSYQTWW